jgi:hypothetical protein
MSKVKHGDFPITTKQIAALTFLVAKASQQLADAPSLDATARRRALKLKNGAPTVVPAIAALVKKYELQTPHVKMDDASSALAYAASLRALVGPASLLVQRIKDEILRSEGAAWKSAVVSYGMLQKVATGVPDLATELAAVEQWFRRGHARGKAARASEPVTTPPAASVNPPAHDAQA